ncbi:extracellular solute-binding protein [Paenibacillus dendritiformis]|uniref:ABC transporter substrate-binding protein n=1 Tax=Paenibacillus dendritiformis TaxID=130049 RepID=UPI00248B3992|nr:extracellular solute-binding protein [Paenibacillus dendritiformis]WGU93509.1 extracellular solute-binding protein [Paenibacillus dendritiformis]
MKRKLMTWTLICSVLMLMLPVHAEAASEKVTLKVLDLSQDFFDKRFGNAFTAKYPNIQIKVIPIQNGKSLLWGDDLRKLEDKEKPDLMVSDQFSLEKNVAEGRLVDLEPYIAQSKSIKLANLNKNIINSNKVNGKLYTLSPTFSANGLFYNKTLFDKYKIKYPKNGMSWAEVMELAAEFKQKAGSTDKAAGFHYNHSLFSLAASDIAGSYNLTYQDKSKGGKKITFNTKEWKSIFDMVLKAAKKEAITTKNNAFLAGDAAMTVQETYLLRRIKLDNIKFEWGVVSEPVNPARPISSAVGAFEMFGISTESKHKDAAWKFIEFIHSDDFAKGYVKDGEFLSGLPTNECCKKWGNKVDLSGLYRLAPVKEKYDSNIPDIWEFLSKEGNSAFTSVLKGTQSLDSMLDSLQKKAQSELDKAWAKKGK